MVLAVGRIDVMAECAICGQLAAITTNRIYQEPMCYKCERVLYRLRAGVDVRTEDLVRAEKAAEYLRRKTAETFVASAT